VFWHLVDAFNEIAAISIHPTKSMIAIASTKRIAWVTRLGKDFVDISFPFTQPYNDNLCFHKIAQVPATNQFNHHFRMCRKEDVNEEVKGFMEMALKQSRNPVSQNVLAFLLRRNPINVQDLGGF
jgi:hypothetical protein